MTGEAAAAALGEPGSPRRERFLRRAIAAALLTAFAGPPIGAVMFVTVVFGGEALLSVLSGTQGLEVSLEAVASAGLLYFISALFAYLIGGIQALIVAVAAFLIVRRHGTVSFQAMAAAGVAGSIGYAIVLFLTGGAWRESLTILLPISILSAIACRGLMGWLGLLRPKPERPARIASPGPDDPQAPPA